MPRPTYSVIINNYNYGSFIERAVDSALAQDAENVEVIVVDDGSTDHSRTVLERYRPQVQLVFQENRGQAGAINAGVLASRGDILCFLDADDWCAMGKLSAIGAAFAADPRLSLVYHRLQPVLSDGTFTLRPIPRTLCSGDLRRRLTRSAGWWPFPLTSAVAIRRAAWNEVGPIPESFRISADAWLVGIYPFVGRVAALPEVQGYYRIHNNSWYRSVDDAAMLRKRMSHWESTVEVTNRFLADHGQPWRLNLDDHFPHRLAALRLSGGDPLQGMRLLVQGLRFGGEPNLLRRARNMLRLAPELIGTGPPGIREHS